MTKIKITKKTSVPALDRSVAILDLVGRSTTPPTAAEITRKLGLPRSSGHGLLNALVEHGLLYKNAEQRFTLSGHVMHWTNGFLAQQDIVTTFQNEIITSPLLSEHGVTLTYLDDNEAVCLACYNGNSRLGFTFSIGMRLPAPFAATGKAMLSTQTNDAIIKRYKNDWPEALTPHSCASPEELIETLEEARQRGYSFDDREVRDGMFCIGVPIFDHNNIGTNGLALSMQKADAQPEYIKQVGDTMREMANRLSRRLGATISY